MTTRKGTRQTDARSTEDDIMIRPGEQIDTDDLDALLDMEAAGWRPNVGDKLVGRVISLETGGQNSTFGDYPLLTVVTDDGELIRLHAFHSVLQNELTRKHVQVGDRIGVKYLGKTDGGDFGSYENYRMVLQPFRNTSS